MSWQRGADQPYTTRFETEVTAVDGRKVWLETTYFFAQSGGQPADRGQIGDTAVDDVRIEDGTHVHVLEETSSFRVGQRVLCEIDWGFRMYCMRAHTAIHLLYGAARRVLDDVEFGFQDITDDVATVAFETDTAIDEEVLLDLEERLNRTVWESRSVSWDDRPVSAVRTDDDIEIDENEMIDAVTAGTVRVVIIDECGNGSSLGTTPSSDLWDVQACSGTHVRNTREVGPVTVLSHRTDDDGLTQFDLAVGPRAIDRRLAEKRLALASAAVLDDSIENSAARLSPGEQSDQLAGTLAKLNERFV